MPNDKIAGGYILLSRRIIDSEIWRKPPLYLKVWIWLLERAQHKEYKKLQRGQLFVTIADIRSGVSWYVGSRKETPSKDQVYQIIEWMRTSSESNDESNTKATREAMMIATTKATQGMLIDILNYQRYQNPKNYESNTESNDESNAATATKATTNHYNINKECNKNDKKEEIKEIYIQLFDFWNSKNIITHKKLTDKLKTKITAALKDYKQPDIEQAIINYTEILTNKKYYWTHKWTLEEFLSRGIEKFRTDACFTNYLDEKRGEQGAGYGKRYSKTDSKPIDGVGLTMSELPD